MTAHRDLPVWKSELCEHQRVTLDVSIGTSSGDVRDMSVGTLLLTLMGGEVPTLYAKGFSQPACRLAAELVRGIAGGDEESLDQLAHRLEALGELCERLEQANPHGKYYSASLDAVTRPRSVDAQR